MKHVRWDSIPLPTTPTVTAGAYTASDVLGGLMTFTIPWKPARGFIDAFRIVDDANQKAAMTLWFFDSAVTEIDDNAPFAPVVADLQHVCGKIDVAAADYTTLNGNAIWVTPDSFKPISFRCPDGILRLYAVPSGTPTYVATTDLQFTPFVYRMWG